VTKTGQNYVTTGAVLDFMFLLSDSNKCILIDWIEKNYHCDDQHRQQYTYGDESPEEITRMKAGLKS
jgi:hypothetical protein